MSTKHIFSDNLAFAYNDYLVKTGLAKDGESYGYITPDYSRFDYLMEDHTVNYSYELEYIGDIESDVEFSKRWDENEDISTYPTCTSSESEDDGDWNTI